VSRVSFSPFNNEYLVVNIKRGGGQNHVWTPLNQNQGSLDPADQSMQTFRFAEPVAARSSSAAFDVISTNTELDVNELIVYRGLGDEHLVSKVPGVFNETATFSPPLQVAQTANNSEFWSLYGDGAHPNKRGYDALGDFVLRQFNSSERNLMRDKNHLFLGIAGCNRDQQTMVGSAIESLHCQAGNQLSRRLIEPLAVEPHAM